MKNKSWESAAIVLGVCAAAIIMGNVLSWYMGDLAKDPNIIFGAKVAAGVMALVGFSVFIAGYYLDRKAARERAEYMKILESFNRDDYQVGKKPPGLAEDGSFQTPFGIRTTMITDDNGDILVVDKATGLLVRADPEDE